MVNLPIASNDDDHAPEEQTGPADDGHPAGATPVYELFDSASCGEELPVNKVVRELAFGRFIALADAVTAASAALRAHSMPLTLPLSLINPSLAAAQSGPEGPSILTAAKREWPLHADAAPPLEAPQPANLPKDAGPVTVKLDTISEVIATRRVVVDPAGSGGDDKGRRHFRHVNLTPEAIKSLVTTGKADALLREDNRVVHLDGTHAEDAPTVTVPEQFEIENVHAFLARPAVPAADGRSVDVTLTPGHVRDLLRQRAVTVRLPEGEVTFEPRASAPGGAALESERARAVVEASGSTPAEGAGPTISSVSLVPILTLQPQATTQPPADKTQPPHVGFYVPYRQTWTLLGYSRGALLNTIALAPQEETTIELFTWDRRTNALEQTSASEVEQNIESTDSTKDTTQVANELTNDTNFKADAHFDVNAKIDVVTVGGGATAGGGASAHQVAKDTTDFIHEQTQKAALRVKASRQSKVSETQEFGSEERTTRKIKNVNMCHALNLDYFEVLVSYSMETACLRQEAQLVALLEPPETYPWSARDTIRRFEPVLRSVLLDRAFVDGFDASRLLAARDCAFAKVCERSTCADDSSADGPAEGTEFDDVRSAALQVMTLFKWFAQNAFTNNIWATYAFLTAAPPTPDLQYPDPTNEAGKWLHLWLFVRHLRTKAPVVWSGLASLAVTFPTDTANITSRELKALHLVVTPAPPATDLAGLLTVDQQALQDIKGSLRQVALEVYKDVPDAKAVKNLADFVKATIPIFDPLGALAKVITDLVSQGAQQGVVELAAEVGIAAVDSKFGISDLDDQGLISAIALFNDAYDAWQKANADLLKQAASTAQALDTLANQRDDQIRAAYPLATIAEACERENALMMHLADNDTYYSFAVYQSRLSSESAKLPVLVTESGGLITSNAIGVVNGKLAFPVNFDAVGTNPAATQALKTWFDAEIRENTDLDNTPDPAVVTLPTPGITLRPRLGTCSGCDDFIMQSREIDLRDKTARAEQQEQEAKRRTARLAATPADLSDPVVHEPVIAVRVIDSLHPPAAAAPASPAAATGVQAQSPAGPAPARG